jgi:antagonist of KipI
VHKEFRVIAVVKPGFLSSVQDRGRYGIAGLGVGHAGAMDDVAARLANALVGNARDDALVEITLTGPTLRCETDTVVALTGAELDARVDGAPLPAWRPVPLVRGSVVVCGGMRRGARAYLAFAGGIDVAPVLGSRSTDLNAAIGPFGGRALAAGDLLPLGRPRRTLPSRAPAWSIASPRWFDPASPLPLRLVDGAHTGALTEASRAALATREFRVAADSNRVGFRLDGPRLELAHPLELVSEAVAAGTLQLPPGGQPIALAAEHPTTGGYPRIAHLIAVDRARLAQRRPGDAVRFAWCDPREADAARRARESMLQCIEYECDYRLRAL